MKVFKKIRTETVLIVLLFSISFLVRSYKISDYLFFGYEQGRDALIIRDLYLLKDFTLVGPPTSIGGIFHGPIYYYLMIFPYVLSKGNPLAAIMFLIFLGSLAPVISYFFAKKFFNSPGFGFLTAILVGISFQYILYSRWLSNVSLAVPLTVAAFYSLWLYIDSSKIKFLLGFVFFAGLASQFEMILLPQFVLAYSLYLGFRVIKLPSIKTIVYSTVLFLFIFSPLIVFDLRHQNIIINSLINFMVNSPQDSGGSILADGLKSFFFQLQFQFQRILINVDNNWIQLLTLILTVWGFGLYVKQEAYFKKGILILVWSVMVLPLIFIGSGNPQNYASVGIAWIFMFAASLIGFFESKKWIILVIMIGLIAVSFWNSLVDLKLNRNIFFVTIQDDLNLKDQKKTLELIHSDAQGETYRLQAYTIPSLHPEGWEYLHQYLYPGEDFSEGRLTYIVIEKNVYPVWEKKWISDLGSTRLIWERKIGLLRIQKRIK